MWGSTACRVRNMLLRFVSCISSHCCSVIPQKWLARINPGVVDQDIDRDPRRAAAPSHPAFAHGPRTAHVSAAERTPIPRRRMIDAATSIASIRITIEDMDLRALSWRTAGNRFTNSGGGAGNQGYLIFQHVRRNSMIPERSACGCSVNRSGRRMLIGASDSRC